MTKAATKLKNSCYPDYTVLLSIKNYFSSHREVPLSQVHLSNYQARDFEVVDYFFLAIFERFISGMSLYVLLLHFKIVLEIGISLTH